jgi:hypothetical protein
MAVAASIDVEILGRGSRFEGVPAGTAGHRHFVILGVNSAFHVNSPSAMILIS